MPTRRMIEPAIWQSESMGRLSIRQRLMFIGMFSNADDQGRLRASAPVIRSMIFPFDDITLSEIESDILQIEAADCIMLYEVDGSRFAQLINWWKYQKHQWAYPSNIPKPNGWIDRLRFKKANKVIMENWREEAETFSQGPSIDQYRVGKGLGKSLGKGLGKEQGKARRKESPKDGAAKAPRHVPAPIPPGVSAYREAAHRYPNKSLYGLIDEHVGSEPDSINFWREVVIRYIALGWNPTNITGQLEWFDRRELPRKNGSKSGNGSVTMLDVIREAQKDPNYGK